MKQLLKNWPKNLKTLQFFNPVNGESYDKNRWGILFAKEIGPFQRVSIFEC